MEMKEENEYAAENRDRSRTPHDEDSRDRDRDRDGDSNERERDRNRRMDRSRRTDRQRGGGRRAPVERRIYVSNIPYEYKWQDLKDLFRKEVGEVSYVEMFNDENNRPRGCAVIEFESTELVQKAVEIMHRYELKGRKLVVKEKADELPLAHLAQIRLGNRMDFDSDRDRHRGGGGGIMKSDMRGGREFARGADIGPQGMANKFGNTFGLSTVFLESLGITGPLVNKVFVANLDYKVDEKMLRDVFKIAGKVVSVEISKDQDNKSRGFGVVEFEHPVEAVQSISMLHNQTYYDRKMSVRMDRVSEKQESTATKLPPGLKGLGMGLGINGTALTDVATLPNAVAQGVSGMANVGAMASNMGNMGGGGGGGQNMGGMGMMGMGGGMGGGGMDNMNSGMGGGNMGGGGMGGNMGGGNMGGGGMGGGGMGGGMGNGMMGNMGMGSGMGNMGSGMNSSNMGSGLGGGLGSNLGGGSGFMNSNMNRGGAIGGSSVGSGSGNGYGSYGSTGLSRDYNHSSSSSNNYTRNVIQLSNLPLDYTWQALRDLCREFGDIRFAEIRSKGTGTVRFQTEADARRAVEMLDRQRLDGRILDVCQL